MRILIPAARRPRQLRPVSLLGWGLMIGCLLVPCSGCGPSQDELMMRAARRKRPVDPGDAQKEAREAEEKAWAEEEAKVAEAGSPPPAPSKQQTPPPAQPQAPPPAAPAPVVASNESTKQPAAPAVAGAMLPIDQRKPATPLSEQQRRARALSNIEKIAEALVAYHDEKSVFPRSFQKTPSGIPSLSWRVELLPYLGYEDLYKRFDPSRPWNREPNKSLLQYIPDEYVSPERFDTNTNYLVPADKAFIFGQNKGRGKINIDDGMDNTLMLLEVNDKLAVPWTKPTDYVPKDMESLQDDLGELRGDGAFAAWANGWPTLISNSVNNTQLTNALTFESGDGQRAGVVHQEIMVDAVSETMVAATPAVSTPAPTTSAVPASTQSNRTAAVPSARVPLANTPTQTRARIPSATSIADAQRKLRNIYAKRIMEAEDDRETERLASEILREAVNLRDDLPGMYALQSAAMRLAIDSGSANTLIQAVDQRVATFDVDAYDENAAALLAFAKATAGRDDLSGQQTVLLRRVIQTVQAGIAEDDFVRTASLAQMAFRLSQDSARSDTRRGPRTNRDSRTVTREDPKEAISRLLTRLRSSLGEAQRQYDLVKGELQRYRNNPGDRDAGAAVGRFLCFIKGDWDTGLPLLAGGGPAQLRDVAERDSRGARDTREMISIGDAWWALKDLAREKVYKQGAEDRASFWYQQAYDALPDSLDKMHCKSRLEEALQTDGTSPLALCRQLGFQLGVNLDISLADMSDATLRRRNKGGRDEYD